MSCQRKVTKRKALGERMTSRCHGSRSGHRLSVRASQERGVVRAMVLTPLPTQQSGIPPASSILASLGCKVRIPQRCRWPISSGNQSTHATQRNRCTSSLSLSPPARLTQSAHYLMRRSRRSPVGNSCIRCDHTISSTSNNIEMRTCAVPIRL